MDSMASLFRTSYEAVNVVLFCFIEPILAILCVRSIWHENLEIKIFVLTVLGIVFVIFLFSLIRMLLHPEKIITKKNRSKLIDWFFWLTVNTLQTIARLTRTSYSFVNLAIYAIVLPVIILLGLFI